MTNLKKTLAVVLAFAMILSMGAVSTFAAYSDVEAGTVVSEAVDILSGLNILTGFEDGTFKPAETVTRAQMAAIICRMLGYEDQAQSSMGSTVFNDVAADHWASGYINVAQAQQIINGYGDGNYGPEDKVTYEQAVKMIVSALGYDLAAQAKGGYPTGYLAIASAEGITKNANGKVGDAAVRGTIAVLVYNSLEVRLMDQTSWSTGSDGDKYGKTDKTILTDYLDAVKVEGVVISTPVSDIVKKGAYDVNGDAKVGFSGTEAYAWEFKYASGGYTYDKVQLGSATTLDATSFDADKVDVSNLLGKYVIAYVGEDEKTGNETIFAIAESKSKNDSLKISAQQLVESGQKYWNDTANIIGYTNAGSSRIQDLTISTVLSSGSLVPNAKVFVNYADVTSSFSNFYTQELANQLTKGGVIEFISNDADSDIEYIIATSYQREAVVETVENVNSVYRFNCYKGKIPQVDTEDEDSLVAVYKDGAVATVADIAANDTVSYVKLADGFEALYVSSATVTGVVDSYDTAENLVTIGGVDYEISKVSGLNAQKLSGEEGTFFLNVDGQIAHNETAPTAVGKYALVLAVYNETTGVNSGEYVQVALADGTIAEYKISDTAKVVDASNGAVNAAPSNPIDTDAEFKTFFGNMITQGTGSAPTNWVATTWKTTVANAKANGNLLVKLTVSNDKVTKARLLPATFKNAGYTSAKYDVESDSLGSLNFDDSTVVFSVKETTSTAAIDPDNIKVGTVADFFVDDEDNYDVVAYDEDDTSSVLGAVVGFGISKPVAADSSVFVVSSKKTTTYDDNDAYVLTGMIAGEETTITVYNKDGYSGQSPENLVAGDVILISEPNAEGIVSDIEQLVDFTKGLTVTAAPTISTNYTANVGVLDQIWSGAGLVTDATSNKFVLGAGATASGDVKNDSAATSPAHKTEVALGTGISYRSAANYTLVDFSENFKTPEVSYESGDDYLFDDAYLTYAYVRYIDGKLADVVVYRFAKYAGAVAANVADGSTVATTDKVQLTIDKVTGATATPAVTSGPATITGNEISFTGTGSVVITVTISASGYATRTETFTYTVA